MDVLHQGLPPVDWDDKVIGLGGNFLQSRKWAVFQDKLARPVVYNEGAGWSWCGSLRSGRGGIHYLFCAYGPTAQVDAIAPALSNLKVAGTKLGVDFVRVELVGPFASQQLAQSGAVTFAEVNPQHTHVLNLDQSEEELKLGLESGHRNRINGAVRRGISVRLASDTGQIKDFIAMMADTAKRNKIKAFDPHYYTTLYSSLHEQGASQLYFAEHAGQLVASAISFDWAHIRYYAHAAANQELNRQLGAATVLVWQMIIDAKAAGQTQFDFWGVAPPGAPHNHKWSGLSAFKRAFGGADKAYHGSWDLPIRAVKYKLYRQLKRIV